MHYLIMFGYFLSAMLAINSISAVELIKELGTFYVCSNEIFTLDLYSYFKGSFMNFSVTSSKGANFILSNNFSFESIKTHMFSYSADIEAEILHTYVQGESAQFLISKGLNFTIMQFNLITGETTFIDKQIVTTLKNGSIIGGAINAPKCFLIINGIETVAGLDFRVNQMFYFRFFPFFQGFVDIWDIKYIENLNVFAHELAYPYFWGTLDGKYKVFAGYLSYKGILSINQEIWSFFRENSTEIAPLNIIDLRALHNQIYIIEKTEGLILFNLNQGIYNQYTKLTLGMVGTPLRFDTTPSQNIYYLTDLAIITTKGIATFDYSASRITYFFRSELPEQAYVSILYPYIFLYSKSEKELNLYNINLDKVQDIYSIPIDNYNKPIHILTGLDGYFLVRSDNQKIELLKFVFTEPSIKYSTDQPDWLMIIAQDEESSVFSTLNIEVIDDNFKVNLVDNYRKTDRYINFTKYLSAFGQSIKFHLYSVVAGWDLTIENPLNNETLIDYTVKYEQAYLKGFSNIRLNKYYSKALYEDPEFYSIDSQGVYLNESLFINIPNPINITKGSTLQILFQNKIIFYDTVKKNISNSYNITSNCSTLFKSILDFTFCADLKTLLICKYQNCDRQRDLKAITNGELIIDITVTDCILTDVYYFYILTTKSVYKFLYNNDLNFVSLINTSSQFILVSDTSIYLVSNSILVYDFSFNFNQNITLTGRASEAWNIFDTLYIKIDGFIYIYCLITPLVQSLIAKVEVKSCYLFPSMGSALILCEDQADVYTYNCQYGARDYLNIRINHLDYSLVNNGIYDLKIQTNVYGFESFEDIYATFRILLYSFDIDFDDEDLVQNGIANDYNLTYFYSLEGKFKGYDLSSVLYVNGSILQDSNFPVVVSNGVSNITYNETGSHFIDHEIIKEKNIYLAIENDFLYIYLINHKNNSESFIFQSKVNFSKQFQTNSSCQQIQYISSKFDETLLLLQCIETKNYFTYSKERIYSYQAIANNLVFILFNTSSLKIKEFIKYGVDHQISSIQVITSCSSCFVVLCIDTPYQSQTLNNNNLIVYSGSWQESIKFDLLSIINFSTLKLTLLQINSVDGSFISSQNCEGSLYLFISDTYYGIRNVLINNTQLIMKTGIEFDSETIYSVGVCGSMLYILSNFTYIHAYYINFHYELSHQFTYKPYFQSSLRWSGSLISCSDYYHPRYLSFYLRVENLNHYQLRILDLKSSMYSSLKKTIYFDYTYDFYYAKTRWLNKNSFTAIGVFNEQLFLFNISIPSLVVNAMSKNQYEEMIEKYKTNIFNLTIGYSNSKVSKNSSDFSVYITNLEHNVDHNSSTNKLLIFIIMIAFCVVIVILVAALVIYKKYISKKKDHKDLDSFTLGENSGISLIGVSINSDSCLNQNL